jgi:hypothetical protein
MVTGDYGLTADSGMVANESFLDKCGMFRRLHPFL